MYHRCARCLPCQSGNVVAVTLTVIVLLICWLLYSSTRSSSVTEQDRVLSSLLRNLSESGTWIDPGLKGADGVKEGTSIKESHPLNVGVNGELTKYGVILNDDIDDTLSSWDLHPVKSSKVNIFVEIIASTAAPVKKSNETISLLQGYPSDHDTKISKVYHSEQEIESADIRVTYSPQPYAAYGVDYDAPFLQRLKAYNLALEELRRSIKNKRGFKSWSDPSDNPTVLWGSRDDFLQQLSNFTEIQRISLSWRTIPKDIIDDRNLLLTKYYEWIGSEPLCTWIQTPGETKARWHAVYNRTCTTDLRAGVQEQSLEPVYLHAKPINPNHYWPNNGDSYPAYFYTTPPPHVFYMNIAEDAVVTSVGDVFSGTVKIVPYSCSHDRTPSKPRGYNEMPIYTELFIMSGHWGSAHFHKYIELFPRVAPYIEFLIDNPDIMIQVSELGGKTAEVLDGFGIRKERLVQGTVRAKIVYLPQGTPCGFGPVQGLQVLAYLFKHIIKKLIQKNTEHKDKSNQRNREQLDNSNHQNTEKPLFVMIHRSGLRRLTDALHIELLMQRLAQKYGLKFVLYHDQQLPSYEETMKLFHNADIVVAPHGAGGSNLLFSRPGTFFVEAVCNQPHVNMCYQRIAHVLGMRYHGIPSEEGCENHIKINPKVFEFVVRSKLEQWKYLHHRNS